LFITQFVSFLVFPVVWQKLLYCIVCQMNWKIWLFEFILRWRSSNVAISIPIPFYTTFYTGHKDIVSQIKFTLFIKKWFLNIGLNYVSFLATICPPLTSFDNFFYLFQILTYFNPLPTIGAFSRFDYPKILLVLVDLFYLSISFVIESLKLKKLRILQAFYYM